MTPNPINKVVELTLETECINELIGSFKAIYAITRPTQVIQNNVGPLEEYLMQDDLSRYLK